VPSAELSRMNPDLTSSLPANRTLANARAAKQDEFYTSSWGSARCDTVYRGASNLTS
jgi:hypothetical protein